jgi:ribose 5-phosphate isomerase A
VIPALEQKRLAARAAIEYVTGQAVIGVGSGTTVAVFIDVLAASGLALEGVVPASEASRQLLESHGMRALTLAEAGDSVRVAVDGCDEADEHLRLIKGAGGAMTREKVVASAAATFVVIGQGSKLVRHLGGKPVPVEVLPMAEPYVTGVLTRLGGKPERREGYVTDNGGVILDTLGLPLEYPDTLERALAAIPGVIGTGLFALRSADIGLFGTAEGEVRRFVREA